MPFPTRYKHKIATPGPLLGTLEQASREGGTSMDPSPLFAGTSAEGSQRANIAGVGRPWNLRGPRSTAGRKMKEETYDACFNLPTPCVQRAGKPPVQCDFRGGRQTRALCKKKKIKAGQKQSA